MSALHDTEIPAPTPRLVTEPLGRVPALDGLRAVAVAAVLLYHGGIAGAEGGFLGVSVFFTLSGFLITSLLLREWSAAPALVAVPGHHTPATGRIDLRRFWSRRFRRLLAASWLTMGLVIVMGALGAWQDSQLRDLRGDVPWSLAELVNWHFIAKGTSYAASQLPPSPLQHFWSLAIEEQFYVILPLLLIGVLTVGSRQGRGPRLRLRSAAAVLGLLTVASAAANGVLARNSIDRAYFGTDTRAAELLVGSLLAFALLQRARFGTAGRRVAVAGGALGAVTLLVLFHEARLTSSWLYPWGLLLTATCTAATVTACLQPGPVATVLSNRPTVALGRISYGVYLLHWPVFLWLTPMRTGLHGSTTAAATLFALRLAVTFVAAAAMFRWVESPIRTTGAVTTRQARVAVPCAAILLLLGTFLVTDDVPAPPRYLRPRDPGDVVVREATTTSTTIPSPPSTTTATAGSTPPTPTRPPRHPTRVLFVGDSVAVSFDKAFGDALNARGISFASAAAAGCGVVSGYPANADGTVTEMTRACNAAVPERQDRDIRRARPDLVVALSTWETTNRVVDRRWYGIGTPEWNDLLRRLYGETIGRLSATGAKVAFLTIPDVVDSETMTASESDNHSASLVNSLLTDLDALPGVTTLRFDRIVCPKTPCPTSVDGIVLRPGDGRHFDGDAAERLVGTALAEQIAALDLDGI